MIERVAGFISKYFLAWVIILSTLAYFAPGVFAPLAPWIVSIIGVIMFGMGMTLVPADFLRVARMPRAVSVGLAGQFLIMPLLGLGIAKAFGLPPDLAMGFVILGACPGGTASNVVAYLARADVALSVTMTACSTIAAVVLTPQIVSLLGGQFLPVDSHAMLLSVVKVVLVPIVGGLLVSKMLGRWSKPVIAAMPAVSVIGIVVVIAAIVAVSRDSLREMGVLLALACLLHNVSGLALGYGFAKLFRLPPTACRTVAIEVAMQNSGLGVALARAHFTSALVALPSSVFSVVHNMTGSAVAWYWARRPAVEPPAEEPPPGD